MSTVSEIHSIAQIIAELRKEHSKKFGSNVNHGMPASVEYKYPFGVWFRGHADASWELTPAVFRGKGVRGNVFQDETAMFNHFQLRVPEYHQNYRTTFDWLCLMQHYGLPTRLLDWTESVLVALYFVVADRNHLNADGKIYALNAQRLNEQTYLYEDEGKVTIGIPTGFDTGVRAQLAVARDIPFWEDRMNMITATGMWSPEKIPDLCEKIRNKDQEKCEKLASPVSVFPNRLNGRMVLQSSMFTLHGGKIYRDVKQHDRDALPKPRDIESINVQMPAGRRFLRSFIVPKERKEQMEEDLRILGIHQGSLFPELDCQATYIKDRWSWFS